VAARSQDALQQEFFCGNEELERLEVFKYLGRMLTYNNNDIQAMQANLKKSVEMLGTDFASIEGRECIPPDVWRILQND
jgi:hypothetical protein